MGVKQKIIYRKDIFVKKKEIENCDCQLVLRSGEVFFIYVKEILDGKIKARNQFGHKMNFEIDQVEECILDYKDA